MRRITKARFTQFVTTCVLVPAVIFFEPVHASPLGCTLGVLCVAGFLAFVVNPVLERLFSVNLAGQTAAAGRLRYGPGVIARVIGFAALVGVVDYLAGDAVPCWVASALTAAATLAFLIWLNQREARVPSS